MPRNERVTALTPASIDRHRTLPRGTTRTSVNAVTADPTPDPLGHVAAVLSHLDSSDLQCIVDRVAGLTCRDFRVQRLLDALADTVRADLVDRHHWSGPPVPAPGRFGPFGDHRRRIQRGPGQ
jgi:hypothetical protein